MHVSPHALPEQKPAFWSSAGPRLRRLSKTQRFRLMISFSRVLLLAAARGRTRQFKLTSYVPSVLLRGVQAVDHPRSGTQAFSSGSACVDTCIYMYLHMHLQKEGERRCTFGSDYCENRELRQCTFGSGYCETREARGDVPLVPTKRPAFCYSAGPRLRRFGRTQRFRLVIYIPSVLLRGVQAVDHPRSRTHAFLPEVHV